MSSMWSIRVINRGSDWVDLNVELAHPDAGPFSEDPVFALSLLTAEAYTFNENYEYIPDSPLGEAIPHEQSYQPFDLEPFVTKFISKVLIYETRNLPWLEDKAHASIDRLVLEMGISKKDSSAWEKAWESHWIAYWENPDNLPQAFYRIWVSDPRWIEHMTLGKSFETASYSQKGPWINENRILSLEQPSDAIARKGVPGFKDSELPPRETIMDAKLIFALASSGNALDGEELNYCVQNHLKFLEAGGAGGYFERLHVAGIPLNVYSKRAPDGEQMVMRSKRLKEGTSLANQKLAYAEFSGAILEGVDFENAVLDGALLTDSFLAKANFEGASLVGVDFTGSDLRGACFRNANLQNTDFEICNCEGADFTGANIAGASFKGANLNNIIY